MRNGLREILQRLIDRINKFLHARGYRISTILCQHLAALLVLEVARRQVPTQQRYDHCTKCNVAYRKSSAESSKSLATLAHDEFPLSSQLNRGNEGGAPTVFLIIYTFFATSSIAF